MKRFILVLGGIGVVAAAMLLGFLTPDGVSALGCGPGSHWIHTPGACPAGDDSFPNSGAVVGIDTNGDCAVDQSIVMSGPTTVHRNVASDDSANFPGLPNPPVADGHVDAIDTEIVSMSLTGGGFTLRAGAGGVPALQASKGLVVEQAGGPMLADSFFDVFFEVTSGPGQMYNQTPLRVTAVIDRVPPVGAEYLHPTGICVDLFTAPVGGVDTGINLVTAKHLPSGLSVGGIAEYPDVDELPQEGAGPGGGSSSSPYAAIAGGAAAVALALAAAGGWYIRRRWLR